MPKKVLKPAPRDRILEVRYEEFDFNRTQDELNKDFIELIHILIDKIEDLGGFVERLDNNKADKQYRSDY